MQNSDEMVDAFITATFNSSNYNQALCLVVYVGFLCKYKGQREREREGEEIKPSFLQAVTRSH